MCPKFEIQCNECQATMKREALAAHKSVTGDCPKTRIPCPIKGCRWHGKREDFHDHERSAAREHVRMLQESQAETEKRLEASEKTSADMLKTLSEMKKAFDAIKLEQARLRNKVIECVEFKIEGATYKSDANGTYFVDSSMGRVNGQPVWKKHSGEWFVFFTKNSNWMITNSEDKVKKGTGFYYSSTQNLDFPFEAMGWKNNSERTSDGEANWSDDNDIKITEVKTFATDASTD